MILHCIVTLSSRYTGTAKLLGDLHLPLVHSRICFKFNLVMFKAINFQQLPSLKILLSVRYIPHTLHSKQAISMPTMLPNYGTLLESVHCLGLVLAFDTSFELDRPTTSSFLCIDLVIVFSFFTFVIQVNSVYKFTIHSINQQHLKIWQFYKYSKLS